MGTSTMTTMQAVTFLLVLVAAHAADLNLSEKDIPKGQHLMPDGSLMQDSDMETAAHAADRLSGLNTLSAALDVDLKVKEDTCQTWCSSNSNDWDTKCGWEKCAACDECSDDYTETPTTATPTEVYATSDGATEGRCAEDGSSYYYYEQVKKNAGRRVLQTNTCPNHPWTAINPNSPYGVTATYKMPLYPYVSATTTTDLSEKGGKTGILFNGAYVFSAYGGSQYGQVTGYDTTAAAHEGDTFDQCGCHASSDDSASYHCHVPPSCLLEQLGAVESTHSPQIGWSPDGFPIYGPRGTNGTLVQLCSVTGGTYGSGSSCLDECSGHGSATGATDMISDGFTYRYYIIGKYDDGKQCAAPSADGQSSADYYPMTPICFKGCDDGSMSGWGSLSLPSCDTSTDIAGYDSSYSPTPFDALSTNTDACEQSR